MSDTARDLLVRGIAAAKANSKDEARFYLERALRFDADREQMIQAWRYLAHISDDPKEKRALLENILARNPADPEARRALAILDGKLDAAEIVDPNRLPQSAEPRAPQPAQARRFVCRTCGGRMEFAPDGNALRCEYCNRRESLLTAMDEGAMLEERDFIVALATSKGHARPVATESLQCQGCGASFVLPPQTISQNCPYCASPHVVEQAETRELIPPEGIVPFAVTQEDAQRAAMEWYRANGFKVLSVNALPSGIYLPVWTFDVGGEIPWTCLVEEKDAWVPHSGSEIVYENDMLVAASHTLSKSLTEEIDVFPLTRLAPYDPRYLADWFAETYQISVSDASLVARWRILDEQRRKIEVNIGEAFKDLTISSTRLIFESYKLILVPLWIARYRYEQKWYNVVVNGQTGEVRAEKPRQGIGGWLADLLGAE
jgi:DNA-directed RNA polymerase subunit RPC12/RpoP